MKKLTVVLLAVLVATIAVVAVSLIAARSSVKDIKYDPVEYKSALIMKRAETLLASGQGDKAEAAYVMVITNYPSSDACEKALRGLADYNSAKGEIKRAVYYNTRLLEEFPGIEDKSAVRKKIDDDNMKIMASAIKTEDSIEYKVVAGDTLYGLARKFNTTVDLLKKMNDLKTDVLQIGQKLKVNTAKFSILVDKATNVMELKKDGKIFKTYTVATGRNNSTPVGVFKVTDKMVQPVWTKPGVGMVMPDSVDYELGARWIPISAKGYGIHGTNDETSIGGQTTAGCVRMYNNDVIELYDIIPVGTEVEIIDSANPPQKAEPGEIKVSGENDGDNT
ncbi:MAG TPA: L,D-transpeptidase family protein [Candidatus Omnitrophota bacterium]|nr:L,D-transpeptidase family protein [Candidatus Omnitrophota bacterium]